MSDPTTAGLLGKIGEWALLAILGVIAWIMQKFTGKHIDSMEKLADKLEAVKADVSEMRGDIRVLTEHATRTDQRLDNLEDGQK